LSQGIHRIVYVNKLLSITRDLDDYKFQPDLEYKGKTTLTYLVNLEQIVIELFKDNQKLPLNKVENPSGHGYVLSHPDYNISMSVGVIPKLREVKCVIDFSKMNRNNKDDSGRYHIRYRIQTDVPEEPVNKIKYDSSKLIILKYKESVVANLNNLVARVLDYVKHPDVHTDIETTEAKARELRAYVEKIITKAKDNSLSNQRLVRSKLGSGADEIMKKLFEKLAPKYADRPGGYLRIVKKGKRVGSDGADIAIIEFV